jgi:uncharacterized protein
MVCSFHLPGHLDSTVQFECRKTCEKPLPSMIEPEDFRPPWYLRNGHVQTILTGFHKPKPPLPPTVEHQIPMVAGKGTTLVYENTPSKTSADSSNEAILLLHGLGSSHAGTYMTTMTDRLLKLGHRVFRADLPGAGPSGRLTPLPPHGACFEEVWGMLIHLRNKLDIHRWRISGISLGGNILLKLLAAKHDKIDNGSGANELSVVRSVAVAPPVRLSDCSTHMERGVHQLYAKYFLRTLKKQAIARATLWPDWADCMQRASFESIRRFDESVTAPLAGYQNAEEYYADGSSAEWLDQIEVPTTILIDQHDPIVPAWMFDRALLSDSTTLRVTQHGGHVGYLHRALPEPLPGDVSSLRVTNHARHHRWADAWIVNELLRGDEVSPRSKPKA